MHPTDAFSIEDIAATERRIRPFIRKTPVLQASAADFGLPDAALSLKLELFQHAGSFKPRGAFANLLARQPPAAGVAAASGGNHGIAVAFAAKRLGVPARIFVPSISSPAKIEKIRALGADLVIAGDIYDAALAECERWARAAGAMTVHAYDQRETLLGQGTLGLEFLDQVPDLQTLLVAVGGGGLIGGVAAALRDSIRAGRIKIVGVEPSEAPTLTLALRAGKPVDSPAGGVAADSLAPRQVGKLMFPLAQELVSETVLVSDTEITDAQAALWDVVRVATEPGGATAFAAVLSKRYVPKAGERVGVVVCGGNTKQVKF